MLSEAEFTCPLAEVGIYSLSDTVVISQSTKSRLGFVKPSILLTEQSSKGTRWAQGEILSTAKREGTVWSSLAEFVLCIIGFKLLFWGGRKEGKEKISLQVELGG